MQLHCERRAWQVTNKQICRGDSGKFLILKFFAYALQYFVCSKLLTSIGFGCWGWMLESWVRLGEP